MQLLQVTHRIPWTSNIKYWNLPVETKSLDLALPSNVTQVRHILGLDSYHRKCIPMFSSIASPITSLTKKHIPFVLTAACQTTLDTIKHVITNSPVLSIQIQTNSTTCSLMQQIIHGQVCSLKQGKC